MKISEHREEIILHSAEGRLSFSRSEITIPPQADYHSPEASINSAKPIPLPLTLPFRQKILHAIQKYLAIRTKMCYNRLDLIYNSVNFRPTGGII